MNRIKMIISCDKFEKEFILLENVTTGNKEELKQHVKHAIKNFYSLLEDKTTHCNVLFSLENPDFNQSEEIKIVCNLISDCFTFLANKSEEYLIRSDYESILFYNLHQLFIDASCEVNNFLEWLFF